MAGGIFNPDNWFYRSTEKLVDLVFLSVFWLACSLPVVTVGPATAALYNAAVRCIRGDERNSWGVFLRTFRAELKVGVLATLAVLPAAAALLFLQGLLYQTASAPAGVALYAGYQLFLLLPLGAACYLFPVLSRFTFRTGGLLLNCAKLAVAHLPSTAAMGLMLALAIWVCSFLPLLAVVLPTAMALVQSLFLERIFRPYIRREQQDAEGP